MPHHSHRISAYRDSQNVWALFCEWCGCDDQRLEDECSRRYKMKLHNWVRSTYGHGDVMCADCHITNSEAACLGLLNKCEPINQKPVDTSAPNAKLQELKQGE